MQFSAWRCSKDSTLKFSATACSHAVYVLPRPQRRMTGFRQQLLQQGNPSQNWTDVRPADSLRHCTSDHQCSQQAPQSLHAVPHDAQSKLQWHLLSQYTLQHQTPQQTSSQNASQGHNANQTPGVDHEGRQHEQTRIQQTHYPSHYETGWQQCSHEQQDKQQQQPQFLWGFDLCTCGGLTAAYVKLLKQHTSTAAATQLGLAFATSNSGASSSSSSSSNAQEAAAPGQLQHLQLLLHHTQQLLPQLQPHQSSLIVYAAAKLGNPLPCDVLSSLLAQQQQQLKALPAAGLTNILWGVAVSGCNPSPEWMTGFYVACTSRGLASLNHHQLTNIIWALGKLDERPPAEWLQEVLAVLRHSLSQLSPSELCNTLWGLAQLGYRPSKGWAKDWFLASTRVLQHCTADHLACIAGSLGLLRLDPRSGHWLRQYRQVVVQQLPAMHAAHVATTMCGLAKRRSSQVPYWVWLLAARQVQLIERQQQHSHSQPGRAAVVIHAGSDGPQQRQAGRITSADIAATVWALPRLLYPTASAWKATPVHAAVLKALAAASLPMLQACSASELVQLAVGFAGLRFYPGAHWLKVHENAVAAKYAQLSAANRARLRAAVKIMWSDL